MTIDVNYDNFKKEEYVNNYVVKAIIKEYLNGNKYILNLLDDDEKNVKCCKSDIRCPYNV